MTGDAWVDVRRAMGSIEKPLDGCAQRQSFDKVVKALTAAAEKARIPAAAD